MHVAAGISLCIDWPIDLTDTRCMSIKSKENKEEKQNYKNKVYNFQYHKTKHV